MQPYRVRHLVDGQTVDSELTVESDGTLAFEDTVKEPEYWALRPPVNAHTHIGDAFLGGRIPADATLEELVAPETGIKHIELAKALDEEVHEGMRIAHRDYATAGWRHLVDFREGGLHGVRLIKSADLPGRPGISVLGRLDDEAPAAVLADCDGWGIPDVHTYTRAEMLRMADLARHAKKHVAIHLSEEHHDPVDDALELDPDLIIHLCRATDEDLRRIHDADIAVCVCPTSNQRFGIRPLADKFEDVGLTWWIGTDNAMFGYRTPGVEAGVVRKRCPALSDAAIANALEAPEFEARWGLPPPKDTVRLLFPMIEGQVDWPATPITVGPLLVGA